MSPRWRLTVAGFAYLAALGAFTVGLRPAAPARGADPAPAAAKKYALLVGCTYYENLPEYRHLWGPEHDVPLFADLLTGSFGFPKDNITRLVGWPADAKARPSYANLVAAFEDLIRKAGPDAQVVILLSGHGTQVPIPESQTDVNDPTNPEPDGMDEVFLPADVKGWKEGKLENGILDDQIGAWLDKLRDKGASVWILFDCCHSGTMMRGNEKQVERQRAVTPQALGVPNAAIAEAAKKARAGAERTRGGAAVEPPLGIVAHKGGKGSIVAFYATQSFEEAPELPRPEGAEQIPDNYYGMLTYTLVTVLKQRQSPLSYRDLTQVLAARYRSERKARPPTPFAEGDLDREVLGQSTWKPADLLLHKEEAKLKLTGGTLLGLTPGSVLAVHPPAGDARKPTDVLGYVKVTDLTPLDAAVVPGERGTTPKPAADALPELARCQIVERDFGDMRIKLAVGKHDDPALAKLAENLGPALDQLPKEANELVQRIEDEAAAEWVLRVEKTKAGPRAVLHPGEGRKVRDDEGKAARAAGQPAPWRNFGGYPADDPKALAAALNRDLPKVFAWQNVWRIAGAVGPSAAVNKDYGLSLAVVRLDDTKKEIGPLQDTHVRPGQWLELRVHNKGQESLWVAAFFLDANFGIAQVIATDSLEKGKTRIDQGAVGDKSIGSEGFVVFAVPLAASKEKPRFEFLEQEPLLVVERGDRMKGLGDAAKTPFGSLMAAAALGKGTTRSWKSDTPTNPAILSWSWVTVPAPAAAKPGKP